MRIEKDFIGTVEIPEDALYGIHSRRAQENFPNDIPFPSSWYRAMGTVKKVCYHTYGKLKKAIEEKHDEAPASFPIIGGDALGALVEAAGEVAEGAHFEHFIVPGISGGAGTSINMNVNEIIANRALMILGRRPGEYDKIHPIEAANVFQSTNDVVPTALKVAVLSSLDSLEASINALRVAFEKKEARFRNALRMAYTQMQQAVPSSYGMLFGSYQEALGRDWWRTSKGFERLKVVNLGGSAIGTGITVPRFFIFDVVEALRRETGKPFTRGEHLQDTTANLDPFVEVHGMVKAHAVNLEKIAGDLRALASDAFNASGFRIPPRQVGSSIMPGKVNPVIAEYVISVSHEVYANDSLISSLAAQGFLDLNAYLPVIGYRLLSSLELLTSANNTLNKHLVSGIEIDTPLTEAELATSPVIATALLPYIGYNRSAEAAKRMKSTGESIFEVNRALDLMDEAMLEHLLTPANLLKLGYRISDVVGAQEVKHAEKP